MSDAFRQRLIELAMAHVTNRHGRLPFPITNRLQDILIEKSRDLKARNNNDAYEELCLIADYHMINVVKNDCAPPAAVISSTVDDLIKQAIPPDKVIVDDGPQQEKLCLLLERQADSLNNTAAEYRRRADLLFALAHRVDKMPDDTREAIRELLQRYDMNR